jgi:two-component system sensor histidine kinase DegS
MVHTISRPLQPAGRSRKLAIREKALREWSTDSCRVFESIAQGMMLTDLGGFIIRVNRAALRMIGYDNSERVIGHTIVELTAENDRERIIDTIRRTKESGASGTIECSLLKKDCSAFHAEMSIGLVKDATNSASALVISIADISTRKSVEDALRTSEQFMSQLLSISPHQIVVVNPDNSIRYVNPALESLTQYSSREIIGRKPPFPWWTRETDDRDFRDFYQAINEGTFALEKRFKKKDGTIFWVETCSEPVYRNGRFDYCLSSWVDITEQKQLRDDMRFYIGEITRAQENERRRIARELHDDTVQSLAALYMEVVGSAMSDGQLPEEVKAKMEHFGASINKILVGVRRFSHNLRPGLLDELGLLSSLGYLIDELEEQNVRCEMRLVGTERRLPLEVEETLFRIAQESFCNIKKHAKARKVKVIITFDETKTRLQVIDDGIGFEVPRQLGDLPRSGRLGIVGMKERANCANGHLCLKSVISKGTTVQVEIPVSSLCCRESKFTP